MKKLLLIALLQLTGLTLFAQEKALWSETQTADLNGKDSVKRSSNPKEYKIFSLDLTQFQKAIQQAPDRNAATSAHSVILPFPTAEGTMEYYTVMEASVMAPELQAAFPEIRSYVGQGTTNPSNTIRFSYSPQKGFSALIRSANEGAVIIDPLTTDNKKYLVFKRTNAIGSSLGFTCSTPEADLSDKLQKGVLNNADDSQLRRFRLAMSCTGEYTTFHGGTVAGAMAAINTTVTRVNGVFENDFNATMILIATNTNVVYTNAGSDPYSVAANMGNWNAELQNTLTSVIGEANYDVGHLFGATGGGGNAGCIGCVCVNGSKGSGYTSPADGISQGDNFDIDYVAHELGHQFGANHTFTHSTQVVVAQLEPGSGSTIMGYAGITGPTDVQPHSDAYFHAISIQQVTNNIKGKACPTVIATGNAVPTANAGADKLLPIGTAFKLNGSGTDADGTASLTYCWEQMDIGGATTTYPTAAKTAGPNFRSFSPTSSTMRRFPRLADHVANGVGGNMWEIVPGIDRTLSFRLTVRDNRAGGAANESDNMNVVFDDAYGPFSVTSQATTGIAWAIGSTQTINWTVNNTTALTGSANVNILLSTDGGVTFPITLLANTPNDGTQTITVPDVLSTNCRLLIEPTGNDYYAINTRQFMIGYSLGTACTDYTYNTAFTIPDNNTAFTARSINVPVNGTITDVNLRVNVSHTYIRDLHFTLTNPSGANTIDVFNTNCNNQDNINVLFDDAGTALVCASPTTGTYQPDQALSVYNGQNALGNWSVRIRDLSNSDIGTVNSYVLTVCVQTLTELPVTCGSLTSTWNGTAWSNGVPGKNTAAIINGNYNTTTNGSFNCCSLTINSGFTVTVGANTYVEVKSDVTVNATGSLQVLNNGSLMMVDNTGIVTNNGTINVHKTSALFDRYDYTFWASPVESATIGSVLSAWNQAYIFKLNAADFRDDNNDMNDDNNNAWVLTPQTEVMTPGKGYAAMAGVTGVFPRQDSVVFSGKVNNGIVNVPVALSLDNTKNNDDFNLIGNPYPSALRADDFINANLASISGTLYFWTHVGNLSVANTGSSIANYSPNDFAYYNLSGGTATTATGTGNTAIPTGLIASGQGFQVDASVNGNVVFNNSMRSSGYANTNFYRDGGMLGTEKDRVWLNLSNEEGIFSQQLIGFFPQATAGADAGYDGYYQKTNTHAAFYSMIGSEAFKIQGRAAFDVNDQIPLGFFSGYNKTYTIAIGAAEGALATAAVYLEDRLLNVIHNLSTSNYVFSTTAGEFNNRFVLRFTNTTLGAQDFEAIQNAVLVYANDKINVASSLERIKEVTVYDVLGRLIAEKKNVTSNTAEVSNVKPTQSALIVKVTLENNQVITKKVIY